MLLIGLDGMTWKVIKPWIDEGYLPTFGRLMENGSWGILESTIPSLSSPAIPSFFTGKNPAKLGFFDFVKPDGTLVSFNDIKEPAIWDILGEYGYKSMIINVRTTFPPRRMNGIMVSGLPPSEESEYTYPPELKSKVKGFHLENEELRKLWKGKNFNEKLFTLYVQRMWRRYETVKNLAAKDGYDLITYWIEETDSIQHWYWHQKQMLRAFFKEVDKILDDATRSFPDRELLIISDHGFHGPPSHDFYPNSWLRDNGYLKLKGSKLWQQLIYLVYSFAGTSIGRVLVRHIRLITNKIKTLLFRRKDRKSHLAKSSEINFPWGVDTDNTTAIASSSNPTGIKIIKENLPPNQDFKKVREEIIDKLRHFKYGGREIITDLWEKEKIFTGRYISRVPSIVYLASEQLNSSTALNQTVLKKRSKIGNIGTHNNAREGIFLAYGQHIKKRMKLEKACILDIAPTVLHLFDVPVPQDMDGRVLKEIINEKSELAKRPVRYQEFTERERIKEKVRELKISKEI